MDTKALKVFFQKNTPTFLMVGGAILVVGGTVIACMKTRKLDDSLKNTKEELDQIHSMKKEADDKEKDLVYSDKDYRKDLVKSYGKGAVEVAKLYWLPATMGLVGFGCIFAAHGIDISRYNRAVAACITSDGILAFYRKNVVEELGEEADKRFRYGLKKQIVESPDVDANGKQKKDEDGKPKTKSKEVLVAKDPKKTLGYSPYARTFAKYQPFMRLGKSVCYGSREWEDSAHYNLKFVSDIERDLDNQLKRDGYLFLNTAYRALGFDESDMGQDVGWKIDPDDPTCDCCVKLTILPMGFAAESDEVQSILKGGETDFIIDFNVFGNIRPFVWGESKKLISPEVEWNPLPFTPDV